MADIKYQLKKIGFPNCIKEALKIIEQLIVTRHSSVITSSLQLANEIISEFIFCERISTNIKGKPTVTRTLNSLEELELLEILCSYFSNTSGPSSTDTALRSAVFLCLFPSGDASRSTTFVKLVSMVVATRSQSVLNVTGTWLQQTGPTSEVGLALAKSIVNDYLILVPDAKQYLHDLPRIAPEFTTCFLCGVAELYGDRDCLPPKALLETVTAWTKTSLSLCTATVTVKNIIVTPFLGLVRWCVMAPVFGGPETEEYSQLHLALLESLLHAPRDRLVSAEQLAMLIPSILESIPRTTPALVQETIDRLTQIVIVLLRTGMVSGNIAELFQQMDKLPNNEFLENFRSFRQASILAPFFRLPQRT